MGMGWQKGIIWLVLLAAWIAAIFAAAKGSPLGIFPSLIKAIVDGLTFSTALATAVRSVLTLCEMSRMDVIPQSQSSPDYLLPVSLPLVDEPQASSPTLP